MEFLRSSRKRSLICGLGCAAALLVLGTLLIGASGALVLLRQPKALYDVPEERLEGAYVTVDLPFLYGGYAYTEEEQDGVGTGRIVSKGYIIDANEYSFCGLLLPEAYVERAEALLEESVRYMSGETDTVSGGFTVTGVVERMDRASLDFYHELVGYDDLPEEDQVMFLPLVLTVQDGGLRPGDITKLVLGVLCLAAAVLTFLAVWRRREPVQIPPAIAEEAPVKEAIEEGSPSEDAPMEEAPVEDTDADT